MPDLNHSSKAQRFSPESSRAARRRQRDGDFWCKKNSRNPSLPDGMYRTIGVDPEPDAITGSVDGYQKTMPQLPPSPGIIPLPQAINKYFELSLYLLVLMGFGALASTGGLDVPTILLVGSALALRVFLLAERRPVVFSERWTTPLTVAYFLLYA